MLELRQARGNTTIGGVQYQVSATGQRIQINDLVGGVSSPAVRRSYQYDALYRLTNESISDDPTHSGSVAYTFDRVGNRKVRTSSLAGIPTQAFDYDANDLLTTHQYDSNGNTLSSAGELEGEVYTDVYDFEDRLLTRTSNLRGLVAEFEYDGDGNRVSETISGVTTTFLVDTINLTGFAQVLEERTDGTLSMAYTYGLDLIAQHRLESAAETHYFGYDALGTTRLLTDATGAVTDRFFYDAYGTLLRREGTTETRYLYTGEQFTASIGMYYLRARYMQQGMGRFWTRDKWEGVVPLPGTRAGFWYTSANPPNRIDPSGFADFKLPTVSIGSMMQAELRRMKVKQTKKQAVRALKELLCVMTGIEIRSELHHPDPMFLGGEPAFGLGGQTPYLMGRKQHSRFHSLLNALIRLNPKLEGLTGSTPFVEWDAAFSAPGGDLKRKIALQQLLIAARLYDRLCKPKKKLTPEVLAELKRNKRL